MPGQLNDLIIQLWALFVIISFFGVLIVASLMLVVNELREIKGKMK